jgi:hypothetical protein
MTEPDARARANDILCRWVEALPDEIPVGQYRGHFEALRDAVAAALQEQQGEHYFSVVCEECGHVTNTEVPCQSPPAAPVSDEALARRIECASCHKAPTDDPTLALLRMNVKGVPGVFLCQRCDKVRAALAGGRG